MKQKHRQAARNGNSVRAPHRNQTAGSQANVRFAEGNAMLAEGRNADAVQKYVEALKLAPEFPDALCNMGCALSRLDRPGSAEAAIKCYRRALSIDPTHALSHNNLGAALDAAGQLTEAIASYRHAVEFSSSYIDARCNLAGALFRAGNSHEAVAEYERVLERDPGNAIARAALLNLSDLMQIDGRDDEASALCSILTTRRPRDWEAHLRLALMQPTILESRQRIGETRARISGSLSRMVEAGVRIDDPFRQFGKTNFQLAYHGLNDREIVTTIANFHLAGCPSLGWIAPHCEMIKPRRHSRLRLGIICEYLNGHTIAKLYRGMIEALSRERFEVILMRARHDADRAATALDPHSDRIVEFPRSLDDARRTVAAEQCDAIFYPEIGMDEFTYYLAFARLAPVQCVSWGHPSTTGIPSIDYFISARSLEPRDADAHYSERLIRLSALPTCYSRPPRPPAAIDRARLYVPRDATIYLCPQSLFKIHPDFDAALGAILREDPNAHILMISGREANWERLLKARFARSFPELVDRVIFLAPLNQQDFFRLLLAADVMLDPFHFGGGNSTYEALAMGTPIVTLPGEFMCGRVTYACYERIGVRELIATDVASYVTLALRVANDRQWRHEVSTSIVDRSGVLYDDHNVVVEFEEFLIAAESAAAHGTRVSAWPW